MRIPGVFSEERQSGLIYLIKQHFCEKNKLTFNFSVNKWHTIYLPRLVEIITILLASDCSGEINLGYPLETSIDKIISTAESFFGYSIPINFEKKFSDHFIPNLEIQSKYLNITKQDFKSDLIKYFKNL